MVSSKKILIVTQYFFPEEFKINDLAEELVARGHRVTVLTGKPNYPKGDFFDGYSFSKTIHENYKGADVIRVPVIRRGKGGAIRLILNYMSFVFFASWYVLTHKMKYDSVFCWETSPITQAYPAILAKKKSKCKLSMWIQDLWPESLSAAGGINNKTILGIVNSMVKSIYKKCDVLFVQSEAFKESIVEKGDFADKIFYAPNWAEDLFVNPVIDEKKYKDLMPDGFKVMFAGNIGEAQDFDSIIKAAELTKEHKDIHWVIVGDGRKRPEVEKWIAEKGLGETVHLLGRFPVTEMPNFFVHADAMLVSLKDDYIFSLTIPSKTQAYMAFGKPILSMINGIGNDIINEIQCGLTANSNDFEGLSNNVLKMSHFDQAVLKEMGEKGRTYYQSNFQKTIVLDTILSNL